MTESPVDRINALKRRILSGEDPSAEEMAEVIRQLRGERTGASETTAKRREPPKKVDLADLFKPKEKS